MKEIGELIVKGFTLSPRNELSQKLYLESGQSFYMYTADRFLEHASKGNCCYHKRQLRKLKTYKELFTRKVLVGCQ